MIMTKMKEEMKKKNVEEHRRWHNVRVMIELTYGCPALTISIPHHHHHHLLLLLLLLRLSEFSHSAHQDLIGNFHAIGLQLKDDRGWRILRGIFLSWDLLIPDCARTPVMRSSSSSSGETRWSRSEIILWITILVCEGFRQPPAPANSALFRFIPQPSHNLLKGRKHVA